MPRLPWRKQNLEATPATSATGEGRVDKPTFVIAAAVAVASFANNMWLPFMPLVALSLGAKHFASLCARAQAEAPEVSPDVTRSLIEDIALVTEDGCERLNTRPRDLVVL